MECKIKGGVNLKRIAILITFLCLLLGVGCNNKNSKEEIVEEGKEDRKSVV